MWFEREAEPPIPWRSMSSAWAIKSCGDVDHARVEYAQAEFLERNLRRENRHMVRCRGLTADGAEPRRRPWMTPANGKGAALLQDAGDAAVAAHRPRSSLVANKTASSDTYYHHRRLSPSATAASEGWFARPRTSSTRCSTAVPSSSDGGSRLGTSKTTLSGVWRRAMSTPALADGAERTREDPANEVVEWDFATNHLGDADMADLIDHIHGRILVERKRRKAIDAKIAALAQDARKGREPTQSL